MKNLILIFSILLIGKVSFAQTETLPNSYLPGYYSDTVSISATKGELYILAKEYLAKNTSIKRDIVQMDDQTAGRLVANSVSTERDVLSDITESPYVVKFTTSIAVKEGKYKYVINNVTYDEKNVTPIRATDMLKSVIKELKKAMASKSNLEF